jgi:hypothetical protein
LKVIVRLLRALVGVSLVLGGCQLIGGIEVREKYRGPSADGKAGESSAAGSGDIASGGVADGGASAGTAGVEGGAAGAPSAGGSGAEAGAPEGGASGDGPAVCGDGQQQTGEACDEGAKNGKPNHCDPSCSFVCEGACPLRVDPATAAPGDGSTWAKALGSLPDAVSAQQTAGGGEVWVKQGVITATTAGVLLNLGSSVAVYGGFTGAEAKRSARPAPTEATVTVLDANKLGYPAVRGAGGATLDGFLIRNASGAGGSALSASSVTNLVVRHVWFKDNESVGGANCGGALQLTGGEARLEACRFEGNSSAGVGGAICLAGTVATLTITGSSFVNNQSVGAGGAIQAYGTYSPSRIPTIHVTGGTFIGNQTTGMGSSGGAIFVSNANLDVTDSDFMSNQTALGQGSGVYCDSDAVCPIVNSTFAHHGFGAAVAGNTPDLKVVNSTFAFNDNCPQACDVWSQTFLAVQNSVMLHEEKIQWPGTGGSVMGFNNCSLFLGGGLGSKPSPFVEPLEDRDGNGVPDYLLTQPADNDCLDSGLDSYATDAGLAWSTLTTSANNCLDAAPVDAGRHYAPTTASPAVCQ